SQTYFAVFNKSNTIKDSNYDYTENIVSLKNLIQERDKKGWQLYNISYVDGYWMAIYHKSECLSGWAYEYRGTGVKEIAKAIKEREQRGYNLINISYGDGIWVAIFNKSKEC